MDFVRGYKRTMNYVKLIILFNFVFSQSNSDFNPALLNDPEPLWPKIVNPLNSYDASKIMNQEIDTTAAEIEGFRVQVFATQDRNKADDLKENLSLSYTETSYVIFEAPNYKVRMGDYLDRKNAEKLRKRLIANGFPSSWIVRTRILPKISNE